MSGIPAGAGQLLGKRLGKFEILALLALGGTAEIYLARIGGAAGFEKYVVVKCLHDHLADDAEFVKMFLDEARLAAHLDHSNIVQTMELGEHEGRYYMVMEFLAGLSLAMIVRRVAERLPSTRVPAPLVLNILAQASAGLHYAHEKAVNGKALNIVHRDISPQNLVISFEGVVKLVDFGIAKAEMRETRTRSGTIKGKFAYMSPEQCVANNVDRRTDVFALGVIGHELLTGRRLFKRPSPYETYQAVMECDVKPPSTYDPEIDRALDQVLMRALTKDKADRYPSAEAFGDALAGYLHHRGIGSGPGDVSRFFDAYFGQELEEHSGRMRELINGRDVSVDTGVSWGAGDGRDSDPSLSDLAAASSGALTTSRRASAGALSLVLDDLGSGSRGEADDEMPAERTRIETNPLERVNELERMAAGPTRATRPTGPTAPAAASDGPTQLAHAMPSAAVPVPAPPPGQMTGQAGQMAPQMAAKPAGAPLSGRFSDAANVPTVIAGADPGLLGPPPPTPPGGAATQIVPMPTAAAGTPASGAPAGPTPAPQGTQPRPQSGSAPPLPQGYPVMNAELSAQIATGATVFPSDAVRGSGPHAPQPPPGAAMPPGPPEPAMPMGQPMPMGPPGSPMPMGSPGSPMPMGHAMPMGPPGPSMPMPMGPPGSPISGGYPMPDGSIFDPQRAADLMSPVGHHYPENVDWGAAAAGRARALPPWLLATIFVGAIGVALLLTVIIARLIR